MGKDSLNKSIYKNLRNFLKKRSIVSEEIFCKINIDLENLKNEYVNINNSKIRYHLFFIILPAISTYRSLRKIGLPDEKAKALIKEYTFTYYKKTADLYGVFGKLPGFPVIFRGVFKYFMRAYPTDGWNIEWLNNNKDEVSFNMHSCLYYDTFKKFDCSELTQIFCGVDNLCYDNMSNKVKFLRTKTIGKGDELCDFKFLNI